LLELKLAMIQHSIFADLFEMFASGSHTSHKSAYRLVRKKLPDFAREYWDKKINFFDPEAIKRPFIM